MVKRNRDCEINSNKQRLRISKDPMGFAYPVYGFGVGEALNVSTEDTHEVLWNVGKHIFELAEQLDIQFEFQEEAMDGILETYEEQTKPVVAKLKHQINQVKQVGLDNKCLQSRLVELGNEMFKMGNQQRKIVQRQKYAEHMSTNIIGNAGNQYTDQALALVPVQRSSSPLNARLG